MTTVDYTQHRRALLAVIDLLAELGRLSLEEKERADRGLDQVQSAAEAKSTQGDRSDFYEQ
jgi:hypothetical protein